MQNDLKKDSDIVYLYLNNADLQILYISALPRGDFWTHLASLTGDPVGKPVLSKVKLCVCVSYSKVLHPILLAWVLYKLQSRSPNTSCVPLTAKTEWNGQGSSMTWWEVKSKGWRPLALAGFVCVITFKTSPSVCSCPSTPLYLSLSLTCTSILSVTVSTLPVSPVLGHWRKWSVMEGNRACGVSPKEGLFDRWSGASVQSGMRKKRGAG